jgi:SAM-dependent methyltransferase
MIEAARGSGLAASWIVADATTWRSDRDFDLIFSNAALQWMADQEARARRLWSALADGGVLAVQVPGERRLAAPPRPPRYGGKRRGGAQSSRERTTSFRYHEPDFLL